MKKIIRILSKNTNHMMVNILVITICLTLIMQILGVYGGTLRKSYEYGYSAMGLDIYSDSISNQQVKELMDIDESRTLIVTYEKPSAGFNPMGVMTDSEFTTWAYKHKEDKRALNEGELIDYDSSNLDLIVPEMFARRYDLKIGESFNIFGNEFMLKGISNLTYEDNFIIPIEAADVLNIPVKSIKLHLDLNTRTEQFPKIIEKSSIIMNSKVELPNIEGLIQPPVGSIMLLSITILFIIITDMIVVYKFQLDRQKKTNFIRRFNGMSINNLTLYSFVELFISYSISFVLSILSIQLINSNILEKISNEYRYYMSLQAYITVYIVGFIILSIIIIFTNRKISKKSIVQIYKENV
ncbi:MAG: hypothetical protein GXY87_01470 [Tissierellia bacterium]|nr:hypothetical protein [Tissierellia bacterium]